MPKLEPYIDDPKKWEKFITASMEGRVPVHIGRGKQRVTHIPIDSVQEPSKPNHETPPTVISPMQGVVMRAKSDLEQQRERMRENEIPIPTGPVKKRRQLRKKVIHSSNSEASPSPKKTKKRVSSGKQRGGAAVKKQTLPSKGTIFEERNDVSV